MKELTHKILSKLISFDNCVNKSNENKKLNEIINLCSEYQKRKFEDMRNFNKGEITTTNNTTSPLPVNKK